MIHTDYGERFENKVDPPDYQKDPDEILDFVFNWKPRLHGDTIFTSEITLPDGLVLVSQTSTDDTVTPFVGGGNRGYTYRVTNRINTVGGRRYEKTFRVLVKDT